jgi:putative peptide zinc metalloprotease protein
MAVTAPKSSDVERRKLVRVRLRPDISVDRHQYEGRSYYVIKDPVSLRYYRLKENEHFLLQFMDGKRTLADAQKAYEAHYRPDRLRLEDLEAFAQQLMKAGLAQNDSPAAGKQLIERRQKRKRQEWIQTFTNLLYIKIPVIDPDKLLRWMLKYTWWIFSTAFLLASVLLVGAAIGLVATNFDIFVSKLPNYYEFFSFKTAAYLWLALGVVKVIHEFGHGLSCRYYGGEVHEMGFLLLCFSPALYCNVTDAWTLPNKWHRIIISAAGIYVELVIAAFATFLWWYTPSQPFIHNLSLSLMVVCSVSTVVFNGNPLMRYDGYYVLADWMEIPNLREKANRFISNWFLSNGLGIEVPPEPYMELGRRILFVTYAIISYLYRWFVTFGILFFLYNFLKPYKLEVVSQALTIASMASMVGWPIFNMGRNIYRRGRVPDMKSNRVMITTCLALTVLAVLTLVPMPVSRLRGQALVVPQPEASRRLFMTAPGILTQLKVRPGQRVVAGEEIALFSNREVEAKLTQARAELDAGEKYLAILQVQRGRAIDPSDKDKFNETIAKTTRQVELGKVEIASFEQITNDKLRFKSPIDGVIAESPKIDDVGKLFQEDPRSPLFVVYQENHLSACLPLTTAEFKRLADYTGTSTSKIKSPQMVLRIHGQGMREWTGQIKTLPPAEAREIPMALSTRGGGPVAVKAGSRPEQLVPQTQHFLVYIDIEDEDKTLVPGNMCQVKIYLKPETCVQWLWRTINDVFELGLYL